MSSVPRPPSDPPGQRRPRRPRRTIDLTASEVASDPVASPASEQPPAEEQAAPAAADPITVPPPESGISGLEPPPPEPGSDSGVPPDGGPRRRLPWRLIGAGAAVVALAAGAWLTYSMSAPPPVREKGPSPRAIRLAQVERQVAEIASRPTVDAKTLDDLAARLARLETAGASLRPGASDPALANRFAALEGELKALGERIDVVARRSDEIATNAGEARARADGAAAAVAALPKAAPPAPSAPPGPPAVARGEVEALANRVAGLEQTAKALETALARLAAAESGGDRTVRLAVTAALLQASVERGNPFASELAAAKSLAGDAKALAPLEPFAASGVPSTSALGRELSALVPALQQASGTTARDETFLERLQAHAEKLVRVRPLDAAGDDFAAVLARLKRRAMQSDLTEALAELMKLPPAARAPAQAWIAKAEARNAAIEASRKFAADALAALGKPAP